MKKQQKLWSGLTDQLAALLYNHSIMQLFHVFFISMLTLIWNSSRFYALFKLLLNMNFNLFLYLIAVWQFVHFQGKEKFLYFQMEEFHHKKPKGFWTILLPQKIFQAWGVLNVNWASPKIQLSFTIFLLRRCCLDKKLCTNRWNQKKMS